jgi:deoxyribodipyrimidine photo-lyase
MEKALYWFRNDLRLHDQAVLAKLAATTNQLHGLYILDQSLFEPTPWGFPVMGNHRYQFLRESLYALRLQLNRSKIGLWLEIGDIANSLLEHCLKHQIRHVFAQSLPAYNEKKCEQHLLQLLAAHGITLYLHESVGLFQRSQLPDQPSLWPEIFTQFRTQLAEKITPISPNHAKIQFNGISSQQGDLPTVKVETDERTGFLFKGGELAGLARLQAYLWDTDAICHYKKTRNGLMGSYFSSRLSPWLANGSLSVRQVYASIQQYEAERTKNESTYWLYFELLWREFFIWMAEKHGKNLFLAGGIRKRKSLNSFNKSQFEQWRLGQCGQDFIDANMRELLHSGWISNRGRQNVASFLIHQLQLDWRAGAAWFEHQLIDYDPCSNYGNWNYLAGIGNDPREKRVFNPEKQADQYDPNGLYRRLWLS